MPKGVDFLCGNVKCQDYSKRITIHGPWPVMDIDKAIAKPDSEKDMLQAVKDSGRDTTLFVFPRDDDEVPAGYRIQSFCQKEFIVFDEEYGTLEWAEQANTVRPPCTRCGEQVMSLKDCVEIGIKCPSCGEKMFPTHWFTQSKK